MHAWLLTCMPGWLHDVHVSVMTCTSNIWLGNCFGLAHTRLWNLHSRTCVLVLAGEGGHQNEVLTLDWHPWDSMRLLSAGMDSMVKVWDVSGGYCNGEALLQMCAPFVPNFVSHTHVHMRVCSGCLQAAHTGGTSCACSHNGSTPD